MKKNNDLGILISRLAVGLPMLMYGISKLIYGIDFIENLLVQKGLPSYFAYGVFVGEVVAPVLLIIGLRSRLAGAVFATNCFTAIFLAQTSNILKINAFGGWAWELLFIYMLIGLSFLFTGAGKFSVSSSNKWD